MDQVLLQLVQQLQDESLPPASAVQWLLSQVSSHPVECAQITHHLCQLVPHHCSRTMANLVLDGIGSSFFDPVATAEQQSASFSFLEELYQRGVAREDHIIVAMSTIQSLSQHHKPVVLPK